MIGTRLAHYEITNHLGTGGMGEVYQATDSKLGRSVALKFLPEAFARDAERVVRFEREARVLASLNHPHIAAIHGIEDAGDRKFLVMELVEGETLADRISRGPVPIDEALRVASQIAEALEAAHEKGIIHRDLKPANIKVTPGGQVKVLDFGLAKAFPGGASSPNLSNSPTLNPGATDVGVILGTAAYMSPEQAKGLDLDRRTDIFALGLVLHEMLTGHQEFSGETMAEVLAAVLKAEPNWNRLPEGTPPAIRKLLRRCLEKDRNRRMHSAADVRIEIDDAGLAPEQAEPPATLAPRGSRGWMGWAAAAIFLAAAVAFAVPYFRVPAEAPEIRTEINTLSTPDPYSFAISSDGRKVVFVASGTSSEGQPRLWMRSLEDLAPQPLAGTEGAFSPFWSPDGGSVGFFTQGKLKRVDLSGGPAQTLADATFGRGGTWNSDGVILFAPGPVGPLRRVLASGGKVEDVTKVAQTSNHLAPQFLPDGRRFLFYAQGTAESRGVYVGSLDGSEPKRLMTSDTNALYSLQGWIFSIQQGTLLAQRFDPGTAELAGEAHPVASPVGFDESFNIGGFSVASTGEIVYRAVADARQLTWFDRTGKKIGTLGERDENGLQTPALSADGRRAAIFRAVSGNIDIWVVDGVRRTRLTSDPLADQFPIWSPDGNKIVFHSNRAGSFDLYEKPSDGSGVEKLLSSSELAKVPTDWSRDGAFIAFWTVDPKNARDIWVLPMTGDRKPRVFLNSPFDERNAQFSPDGRWMAYESNESGSFEVYVRKFPGPGGQWQISTAGGVQPRWHKEGKELYYITPDGKLVAVPIAAKGDALIPGAPETLFQTHFPLAKTNPRQQYDAAPDGRFLVNQTVADSTAPITLLQNWKPSAKGR